MQDYDRNGAGAVAVAAAPAPALASADDRGVSAIRQGYLRRIAELRGEARLDAVSWNWDSEADLLAFISANPGWRQGRLGLMDNGNLYAVWKDAAGSLLSIQFRGRQFAEFVIFQRRPGATEVSRIAGSDTLDGVKRQVGSFDLLGVVSL